MQRAEHLIWVDLEMNGLKPAQHVILEIAAIVTDARLNILAQGPVLAIHQPEERLSCMDEWNYRHHRDSGLLAQVRASRISCQEAEQLTLAFVREWAPKGCSPLCGNSVWHDRRFLGCFMPELEEYFHYRNIDVSTLKELAKRWLPSLPEYDKECRHRAYSDIEESIKELRYYRKHLFNLP